MKTAFVDAAFYIAILNPRDQYASTAIEVARSFHGSYVTTTCVLTEVCNLLSSTSVRVKAARLVDELEAALDTEIVHPDRDLWSRGRYLYASRPDKAWSLTDCLSFIVMQEQGITEALTADRHFEQAGFVILLK